MRISTEPFFEKRSVARKKNFQKNFVGSKKIRKMRFRAVGKFPEIFFRENMFTHSPTKQNGL